MKRWLRALWIALSLSAGNFLWAAVLPSHHYAIAAERAYFQFIAVFFTVAILPKEHAHEQQ